MKERTYKNYAVVCQNIRNGKVKMEIVNAYSEGNAMHDFSEIFEHSAYKTYNILSVTEIPEFKKNPLDDCMW